MLTLTGSLRRQLVPWTFAATAFAAAITASAQGPPAPSLPRNPTPRAEAVKPGEAVLRIVAPTTQLTMISLESQVVSLPQRIKVVDGHNPDVVNIMALSPNQLRIQAESAGVTKVKLIDEMDNVHVLEILVEQDTRELEAYLERLFPGSTIEVFGFRDSIVLRGWVTDPSHIPRIIAVAESFSPKVHNQLEVAGASQVQLHVKVMEVQRSKLRELGFNFVIGGENYFVGNSIGGIAPLSSPTSLTAGAAPVTGVASSALTASEVLFGITSNTTTFQGFVKALQSEALAKTLAEPVLVTTSGRPASMLSGGTFPVLIPSGALGTATIAWREFGIRLDAVPIVLGNGRLRLDIAPEVSDRDFSSGVSFNGLVVPGIATRKVNTQVEMRFGETLMIGGLISTRRNGTNQKIPLLGELPLVGAVFSRKKYELAETELLIMVTPQLASPLQDCQLPMYGPGQATDDPIDKELYFDGFLEVPRYGPECPDCELPYGQAGGQPIPIDPYQMPSGADPNYAPTPETPPNLIVPTSGTQDNKGVNQASGLNPFRSTSSGTDDRPQRRPLLGGSSSAARLIEPRDSSTTNSQSTSP